jgi:hypothetical protein
MTTDLPKVQMQLIGADGNAFAILSRFKREARKQGWDADSISRVIDEATSGDYHNLLSVIVQYVDDDWDERDIEDDDDEY